MALPKDFAEQLALKLDEELYDMVAHAQDYLPEALAAAKAELDKRNLAPARVAQLETLIQSQREAEVAKAAEPLSWPMRILIFCLCAGIAGAILVGYCELLHIRKDLKEPRYAEEQPLGRPDWTGDCHPFQFIP